MSIINIITEIDDINRLERIHKELKNEKTYVDEKSTLKNSITELTEGLTYQQILEEQKYHPITYAEFRGLADQIEWNHSLEELLLALD